MTTADPLSVRLLYTPHDPTPRQHLFHLLDTLAVEEAMYGGAAGGGKSDALLASALRYVDVPGYAALLLRKTYRDLALPGALMERAAEWLSGTDAKWDAVDFRWTFPSGATLSFGYLANRNDKYRYQGAEFQFIGFDELTQFDKADYLYLFSRLRRPAIPEGLPDAVRKRREALARVPLRMRSATNPGGTGHHWVKARFIEKALDPDDPDDTAERAARRIFVPARLDDNPHVDAETYESALSQLDPVTRERMRHGDWDVEEGDKVYRSSWLTASKHLGDVLDRLLAEGRMPPPVGGALKVGLDFGEHAHALIGWPLAGGGMYVCAEVAAESSEATTFARRVLDVAAGIVELGQRARPAGYRPEGLDPLALGVRPGREPSALPAGRRPGSLIDEYRFDAAGVGVMRTFIATVRTHANPRARTVRVAFGAPAAQSGSAPKPKAFKAEVISHNRTMLARAAYGLTAWERMDPAAQLDPPPLPKTLNEDFTGALAIGSRCPVLRDQIVRLEWLDKEAGTLKKEDDHGPDALIALNAPAAKAARSKRKAT